MGIIRTDSQKCLPKYLYYYLLKSKDFRNNIQLLTQGANINNISSTINSIKIPLPSIEKQNELINELDSYQQIISGAQNVLSYYIPQLPHYDATVELSLGDTETFDIQSGGTPNSQNPDYWNGDINWITLADLPVENHVTHIYSSLRKITSEGLEHSNAKLLPKDTVVVSSRATIGRIGIAKEPLATNQGFKNVIIKKKDVVLPEFLALMLREKVDEMNALASGATFKEISKTNFESLSISVPSLEEQKKILDQIQYEQSLIEPSKKLIKVFSEKIENRIKEIWGD